ncbi:HET-domain-containing protein [Echria macrotheca]|uniref:HET-domain-containing protein n=1 Tax=Echria macrotheca TaxID=438768 RepID=A0AAJ0B394_9PEZI|nr:HET-domain-containing protein [Echria macrotheca]
MSTASFSYTPLPPGGRTIRRLSILPSPDFASSIRVCLQEISLDNHHLPHALSYVWGDATDTVAIEIRENIAANADFQVLHVTRNCEQALRHVRHATETIYLWVDAICIDQKNLAEKGQQVGLMAEIYRKARGVLAWLGSGSAAEAADDVDTELRMAVDFLSDAAALPGDVSFPTFRQAVVRKWAGRWSTVVAGLKRIFNHPWWNRLWVYQEIILCRDATVLLGGGHSIPWETMVLASWVLTRVAQSPASWAPRGSYPEGEGDYPLWKALRSVDFVLPRVRAADRKIVHDSYNVKIPAHLLDQGDIEAVETLLRQREAKALEVRLSVTQPLRCSDPRDRVYALMGTVTAGSSLGIVPDYTKTHHEVYWDFATAMAPFTLEFLCSAGIGISSGSNATAPSLTSPQQTNIPSWVPDWYLIHSGPSHAGRLPGVYNASLKEAGVTEVQNLRRILSVRGHIIDAVEKLLPKPFGADHQAVLKAFPTSYADTDRDARTRFRKERIRNLLRTCTANADLTGHTLSEETVSTWIRGSFLMTDAYSDKEDGDEDEEEEDDQDEHYETGSEEELFQDSSDGGFGDFLDSMTGYGQAVKAASEGRRFLRTREGRMGLGPGGVAAGDVICVVFGCSTPLVLRPDPMKEGFYQLVGACYVQGVMYGEGVKGLLEPSTILIS